MGSVRFDFAGPRGGVGGGMWGGPPSHTFAQIRPIVANSIRINILSQTQTSVRFSCSLENGKMTRNANKLVVALGEIWLMDINYK